MKNKMKKFLITGMLFSLTFATYCVAEAEELIFAQKVI